MPEYITREEFDMLAAKLDERHDQTHHCLEETQRCIKDVSQKQDKTLASFADHKAMHVGYDRDMKQVQVDIQYIKSDKLWLNRIVIAFCVLTALGAVAKFMFGIGS